MPQPNEKISDTVLHTVGNRPGETGREFSRVLGGGLVPGFYHP
jgi:hypothetical protein